MYVLVDMLNGICVCFFCRAWWLFLLTCLLFGFMSIHRAPPCVAAEIASGRMAYDMGLMATIIQLMCMQLWHRASHMSLDATISLILSTPVGRCPSNPPATCVPLTTLDQQASPWLDFWATQQSGAVPAIIAMACYDPWLNSWCKRFETKHYSPSLSTHPYLSVTIIIEPY